jgi:CubicO group peptidase (beta-lactamase class C family)
MTRLPRTLIGVATAVAMAVVTGGHSSAQQPSIFSPGGSLPVLDAYLEPLRQQAGIPGMSVAVLSDGKVIWEKGYGFANIATRERAAADTPYLVGDLSQTLAAALLLQCVEQRRITLDDPISRYGVPASEPDATLRGLLSHAPPKDSREPFFYSPDRFAQLTPLMEYCAPQPYRKSVAHRILNRYVMRDSVPGTDLDDPLFVLPEGQFDDEDVARYRATLKKIAVPYRVTSRTRADRVDLPLIPMNASNGLVSTVRDLARFDGAFTTLDTLNDPPMLQPETLAVAWRPAAERNGTPSPMGLGWFVQVYRGERVVWHFGSVPNAYSSLILKLPERNITFIVLANSDGLSAPFQLSSGDVTKSLFATLFLRLTT